MSGVCAVCGGDATERVYALEGTWPLCDGHHAEVEDRVTTDSRYPSWLLRLAAEREADVPA